MVEASSGLVVGNVYVTRRGGAHEPKGKLTRPRREKKYKIMIF